jgi:hypothetical protein
MREIAGKVFCAKLGKRENSAKVFIARAKTFLFFGRRQSSSIMMKDDKIAP